jgi:hypothetical protein
MAVFCSSLTAWFPGMVLTYFLNNFEMGSVAPIVTGITLIFTFYVRDLLLLLLSSSSPSPSSLAVQPSTGYGLLVSRGFLITHNNAPQLVELLWTSDQLVAETST